MDETFILIGGMT